jgi:hypothetical protein
MRRIQLIVAASGIVTAGLLGWTTGCVEKNPDRLGLSPDDLDASAPVVISVPACDGDPTDPANAKLLTKDCAIFVRSGEGASGDGTPEKPLRSLQKAIVDATSGSTHKWVIGCAADEFKENISITTSSLLYGGFDCTDLAKLVWSKDNKTKLTAPAETIPLKIAAPPSGGDVTIKGFEITAASITDPKKPGASSIAVIVNQSKLNLSYTNITAGDASGGLAGEDAEQASPMKPVTAVSNNGVAACADKGTGQSNGGTPIKNQCGATDYSLGGFGGNSVQDSGFNGQPGKSEPTVPNVAGAGGMGDQVCTAGDGGKGKDGIVGTAGMGSGTLNANGWTGSLGGSGEAGKPGQGGGGGGGQKGGATVCMGGPGAGPTGGSGGAGGCGGQGGKGGGAGGSSIAVVSINAVITLDNCTLKAGKGGAGGAGGKGQPGGTGGDGGKGGTGASVGLLNACNGGAGGQGGNGGPGGGGAGGHSLAIAYTQVPPTSMQEVVVMPGAFGPGGKGGSTGNLNAPNGAPGANGTGMGDGILEFK